MTGRVVYSAQDAGHAFRRYVAAVYRPKTEEARIVVGHLIREPRLPRHIGSRKDLDWHLRHLRWPWHRRQAAGKVWSAFNAWQRMQEAHERRRQEAEAGWHFTAWKGPTRWIGLAKRSPFVTGDPVTEPGEVWFEVGDSEHEALSRVRASVAH